MELMGEKRKEDEKGFLAWKPLIIAGNHNSIDFWPEIFMLGSIERHFSGFLIPNFDVLFQLICIHTY